MPEDDEDQTPADLMAAHLAEWHPPMAFRTEDINVLVAEHRVLYDDIRPIALETNRLVKLIVAEIYGKLQPTAADPDHRVGGMVTLLREIKDELVLIKNQNGSAKDKRTKWGKGEWAVAVAFIGVCGTVIAALITTVWG